MTNAYGYTTPFCIIETFDLRSRKLSHLPIAVDVQSAYSCKVNEVDLQTSKMCTFTQVALFVESGKTFERVIFNAVTIRNLSGVKKKFTWPRVYVMHCENESYDYLNSAEKSLEDMKKQYKPVKRCFVIYEDTKPAMANVNGLQYVFQRKSSDDAFRMFLFSLVDDAYS
uniref:Ras-associating domain-containing protein n=1 Tax=Panagrellus redivivus TaxID=6233 RepID=A0A7E4UQ37_PANRE